MNLKRRLATATATGLLTLTGCADHHRAVAVVQPPAAAVAYTPTSMGANGYCYYLDDPQEAYSLIAAGLCQPGWQPRVMPLDFHYMYADYLASPAYVNVYVPVSYRAGWANQWGTQSTFYVQNKTIIINKEKTATYKGSDGKPYTGNVTNFSTPKPPASAPLPVGSRSSAPLPVGNARSTAPAAAPSASKPPASAPLPAGGARQPSGTKR